MRVHLTALGCRLNEAELETWSRQFLLRGHEVTGDAASADLVVVNTCAVTQEAVRKSRKLLRRSHRENPRAKLLVSGCYASLDPAETAQTLGVDLIVDNRQKDRLVEIATRELNLLSMPQMATEPGASPLFARGRHRAFVKVQDGCRYRCTYCIVTLARGEERSRPIADVVAEVNQLHGEGIREAVLAGVHLGGYGSDCGSSLSELIKAVLNDTDMERIRLGSLEPWDLPPGFWNLFDHPRLMPHLHLPLQSGSNPVLRRMARRCSADAFAALVRSARSRVPDLNVTTDVIVGFPGETEAEWQRTLEVVEDIGFGHLHIFAYSPRPGTKAAALPGQVGEEIKKSRSQELHRLGKVLERDTLARFVGRSPRVLIEGRSASRPDRWFGYTPNYLPILIEHDQSADLSNQILEIRTLEPDPDSEALRGIPLT